MAAVTICGNFGAQKLKSDTVSTVSPSISHEVMGPDALGSSFSFPSTNDPLPMSTCNNDAQESALYNSENIATAVWTEQGFPGWLQW